MVKIEVEISDDDANFLEDAYNLDIEKLIKNMVKTSVENLKQIATLHKAGVKLDLKKIQEVGLQKGKEVFDSSHKEK